MGSRGKSRLCNVAWFAGSDLRSFRTLKDSKFRQRRVVEKARESGLYLCGKLIDGGLSIPLRTHKTQADCDLGYTGS